MFIAKLFTVAKTWKQPKCPAIEDGIIKMWSLYTTTPLIHKKGWNIAIYDQWMGLEKMMLSEIRRTEKAKNHSISFVGEM